MPPGRTRSLLSTRAWVDKDDEPLQVRVSLPLTYEQWQSVLDALEPGATTRQVDDAQDTLNIIAPRAFLEAAEEREVRR